MIKALPYIVGFVLLAAYTLAVDNMGYDRGHASAEETCRVKTVPDALDEANKVCNKNGKTTVESCDAIRNANATAADTIDRLRQQYGECAGVPVAEGDKGHDGAARVGMPILRIGAIAEAERKNGKQVGALKACQIWVRGVCEANPGQCN